MKNLSHKLAFRAILLAIPMLLLAPTAKGADAAAEKAKQDKEIAELFRQMDNKDVMVWNKAVEQLRSKLRPGDCSLVLRMAQHKRPQVRAGAFELFYKYRSQSAKMVPVVLEGMRDKDVFVRYCATRAAGQYGPKSPKIIQALIFAVEDNRVPDYPHMKQYEMSIAVSAVWGLSATGRNYKVGFPVLINKSRKGPSAVRCMALKAMGYMAFTDKNLLPSFMPPLLDALKDQKHFPARRAAAFALATIGPAASSAMPELRKALLTQAIVDQELAASFRQDVLGAFQRMGPLAKEAIPEIELLLEDPKQPFAVREDAARVLGTMGPAAKPAVPALTRVLNDPNKLPRNFEDFLLRKRAQEAIDSIQGKPRR